MASTKKTEVTRTPPRNLSKAPTSSTALAVTALEDDLLADAGRGFEEASRDAYAIPFLRVLQDLSPQVKSKMTGYIKGAKPGQIFNTVTQALQDAAMVVPCYYQQTFIEWKPRSKGGGLVAVYDPSVGAAMAAKAVRDGGKSVLPNGNELMDTRSHFVLLVHPDGTYEQALIALSSTGIKTSRRWMSQMRAATVEVRGRTINAPMFAYAYPLGVEEQANDKGSWFQFTVGEKERVLDADLYRAARDFAQMMAGGAVKVDYSVINDDPDMAGAVPSDLGEEIDA
jgi:hypothetical protein